MMRYFAKIMMGFGIFVFLSVTTVVLSYAYGTDDQKNDNISINELGCEVVFLSAAEYAYTGYNIEPPVRIVYTNSEGEKVDVSPNAYDVYYSNNLNVGEAEIKVIAKETEGYTGQICSSFKIVPKSIEGLNLVLNPTSFYYDGREKKPTVELTDEHKTLAVNKDFIVNYSTCKEVGTNAAKATITGIGNYKGTIEKSYTIKLGTVTKLQTTPISYNQIQLDWNEVPGATGYIIYRRLSTSSKYIAIKNVKEGDTTKYINKNVSTSKVYFYKVRAYRKLTNRYAFGYYSPEVGQKAKVSMPVITKVNSMGYNAINICWKNVTGANGYGVYRSTSPNGTYTRIGTVKAGKKLEFKDSHCVSGSLYYYKICAYRTIGNTNYYGNKSTAFSGKAVPIRCKISSYSEKYVDKVLLKWTKIPGASGYEIYRSNTAVGGYEKIKTITTGGTTSWMNSGLTSGKTYYYKMRAYRNSNGKKVFGWMSSAYEKSKGGWKYVNGYKLYYNAKGQLVKDVSAIIGKQASYVIKVNKKQNTVTVYAKDGSNGYIIPVKAFVCSTGYATPTGTFYTPQKYRWHTLMGPCWGQWDTRIVGGILFHSVFYNSPNNNMTLSTNAYNKLGTTASHGCVRLKAGDAKWIYDNCKLKTKVIIYNSSVAGPLGKPTSYKLPSWHRWDPTDPTAYYKCKQRGCH